MVRLIQKCALIIAAVVYIGFIFLYPNKCGIGDKPVAGEAGTRFLICLAVGLLIVAPAIGALWPRQRRSKKSYG